MPASPRARTRTRCPGASTAGVSSPSMTASPASARCRWPACIARTRRARPFARSPASIRPRTASCCIRRICASAAAIASTRARSARRSTPRSAISAHAARWTNAPIAPVAADRKPPAAPRNSRNTARTASAKARCRSVPRCAPPNRCLPATTVSSRRSTRRAGGIVMLGTIVLVGLAYLIIGRIRIAAGRSGQKILRFKAFERFSHWLTAVSFVVLGLTGLNITFGKILLLPVVGPDTFSDISEAAKYVHNFVSFSFIAGLVLITVIFFKDNLLQWVDIEWLKRGGGFIKNKHAPAGRFKLGEKLVYWLSLVAGVAASVAGLLLLC